MRRTLFILFILSLCLLTSCTNDVVREQEKAHKNYEKSKNEYENFQRDYENWKNLYDKAESLRQ